MERKLMQRLLKWKNEKSSRMPMLLYGARQVGKTYIMKELGGRHYSNTVYINFERMAEVHDFFSGDIDPERIVRLLGNNNSAKILPEETLIIFDEIQSCERALTSLKYFAEDAPDYHVIAAGSLLGVAVNRSKHSFPVGKVYMETLFPMDFEEFLMANGEHMLIEMIGESYEKLAAMPEVWHNKALEYYRMYTLTGGMPAVVKYSVENNKTTVGVDELQELIVNSYVNDMAKYASASDTIKIIACYESIPAQLAKDNKKFQYKIVKKGGSASIFGDCVQWLHSSGVVLKCYKTQGMTPPAIYNDPSSFKLYMGDVGLLAYRNMITMDNLLTADKLFVGGLAENYVACQLSANGYKLYYWESENRAEVDFLIQKGGHVVPIEVKANLHSKSKSLDIYRSRYSPDYSIRISGKNFAYGNNIKAIPLYATYLI
jgi:predicted AAA+ superfamily ATPase